MAVVFGSRTKRVTDPLDEKVKACICGRDHRKTSSYVSSGSEHEGDVDDSPCLSDLIHGFLEDESAGVRQSPEDPSESDSDFSRNEPTDVIEELLNPKSDSFRLVLLSRVFKSLEMFSSLRSNMAVVRRNVMMYLRESGYNAGICKTKWESSGGLTAGNYEFIDVVVRSEGIGAIRPQQQQQQQRYFVDIDFASEFEIARATPQYERLSQILPRIYVGRSEELKQIIRLMCDAAKRSLKRRDLHLPPWRKNRYMQAKWFSPYRRTTNQIPANASFPATAFEKFTVKCRSVGFNAVSDSNGRFVMPAVTRTR